MVGVGEMLRGLLLSSCLLSVGCRRHDEPKPVPTSEDVPVGEPARALVQSMLCGTRAPCTLVTLEGAGVGLWIAKITAPLASCTLTERWLVRSKGATIVDRRELLRSCGGDEGRVTVEPGLFTHEQSGGDMIPYRHGRTLQLDPLRVTRVTWWSRAAKVAIAERGAFDFLSFRGRARWYRPDCPASGALPPLPTADELEIVDRADDPRAYVYDPLPVVDLPDAFRSGGWRDTPLGSCAPVLDGAAERGFLLAGLADEKDGSVRVIAAKTKDSKSTELYVQVADDTLTAADRVDLWVQEDDPDPSEACIPTVAGAGAGALTTWSVRLDDGKVDTHGSSPAPLVERVAAANVVRLRVVFTMPSLQAITVAFSDSDDGKTEERKVATSRLKAGRAATLGRLYDVAPKEAVCTTKDGALDRVIVSRFPARGPVLAD